MTNITGMIHIDTHNDRALYMLKTSTPTLMKLRPRCEVINSRVRHAQVNTIVKTAIVACGLQLGVSE